MVLLPRTSKTRKWHLGRNIISPVSRVLLELSTANGDVVFLQVELLFCSQEQLKVKMQKGAGRPAQFTGLASSISPVTDIAEKRSCWVFSISSTKNMRHLGGLQSNIRAGVRVTAKDSPPQSRYRADARGFTAAACPREFKSYEMIKPAIIHLFFFCKMLLSNTTHHSLASAGLFVALSTTVPICKNTKSISCACSELRSSCSMWKEKVDQILKLSRASTEKK